MSDTKDKSKFVPIAVLLDAVFDCDVNRFYAYLRDVGSGAVRVTLSALLTTDIPQDVVLRCAMQFPRSWYQDALDRALARLQEQLEERLTWGGPARNSMVALWSPSSPIGQPFEELRDAYQRTLVPFPSWDLLAVRAFVQALLGRFDQRSTGSHIYDSIRESWRALQTAEVASETTRVVLLFAHEPFEVQQAALDARLRVIHEAHAKELEAEQQALFDDLCSLVQSGSE